MTTPLTHAAAALSVQTPLRLGVLLGSTRDGRFGSKVADRVLAAVKTAGHIPTLFDAKELNLPLLQKPLHHYNAENPAPEWLTTLGKKLEDSDAFIVVDGEYNWGPTPGMINLLDHFYHSQFKMKAAGLAVYGAAAGGARSAYVLRNTLSELGMVVTPSIWTLPQVWTQFDAEGELSGDLAKAGLDKFLAEFLPLATALRDARPQLMPKD